MQASCNTFSWKMTCSDKIANNSNLIFAGSAGFSLSRSQLTKTECPYAFKNNSEGLLPECSVSVKEIQSKDDSSWNMHGNFVLVYEFTDHDRQGRLFTDDRKMLYHPGESLSEWPHVGDHTRWQHMYSYSASWDYYSINLCIGIYC